MKVTLERSIAYQMDKINKNRLKKEYLERTDPIRIKKRQYQAIDKLNESDFTHLNQSDLELHIIDFINFKLLEHPFCFSPKTLPQPFKNFYCVYYLFAYVSQDGIECYLGSDLSSLFHETLEALNEYGMFELHGLVSSLNSPLANTAQIEEEIFRLESQSDKKISDYLIQNMGKFCACVC